MTNKSNIIRALATFQSLGLKAAKDGFNPHFKNRYPTLRKLMDTIRAPLAEHGLYVTSRHEGDKIITSLVHPESGEFIESWLMISPQATPQQQGSAITYFRRYAIMSMLDLVADDDDANLASTPLNQPPTPPANHQPQRTHQTPSPPSSTPAPQKEPFENYLIDTNLMQFIATADADAQANGQPFDITEFLNYYYEITPEQIAAVANNYYGQ